MILVWWQRRKARKADEELLNDVRLKEAFLGPISPATGKRPVDASQITVERVDARTLRPPR